MPIPLNHVGAGIITLAAPASGAYTLTFPSAVAAGTGYILSSDTSGNLSWVALNALTATGELQALVPVATNGIVVNSLTISTSYTIAAGYSGSSAGPVTLGSGVTVTVASGSRWVVL